MKIIIWNTSNADVVKFFGSLIDTISGKFINFKGRKHFFISDGNIWDLRVVISNSP